MNYRFTTAEFDELCHVIRRTADKIRSGTYGSKFLANVSHFLSMKGLVILQENECVRRPPFLRDMLFPKGDKDCEEHAELFRTVSDASLWLRAFMLIERIRLLFSSIGCKKQPPLRSYARYIMYWYALYKEGRAEQVAKYQSVSAFNILNGVEPLDPVELPDWCKIGCLGFGVFKEYFHLLLKTYRRLGRRRRFRYSQCFLYFKKGCPPVAESFLANALTKHQKTLTTKRVIGRTSLPSKEFVRQIKDRARLICAEVLKVYRDPDVLWDPSLNASYECPRNLGGQMGDLTYIESCGYFDIQGKWICRCESHGFFFNGKTVVSRPGPGCLKIRYDILSKELNEMKARPVGLTEPLKVRTITCEPPNVTHFFKGLQLSLWKCLRQHPTFKLVGEPVTSLDIPVGNGDFISVDYSAATDNFCKAFTRWIVDAIAAEIKVPSYLLEKTLNSHLLDYTKVDYLPDELRQICKQKTGQLMGSILSFIVLCLGNAVVCSMAISPDIGEPFKLSRLPLLINGDDALFLGTDQEYNAWLEYSSAVGLEPSVGKVYRSSEFCVINSTLYYKNKNGIVRECPYPNANYLQYYDGRTFSRCKGLLDLGDAQSGWLAGFRPDQQYEADCLFFREFDRFLKCDEMKNVNWFLDQTLGGLGLDYTYRKVNPQLTKPQMALLARCLRKGQNFQKFAPLKRTQRLFSHFSTDRQTVLEWKERPRVLLHKLQKPHPICFQEIFNKSFLENQEKVGGLNASAVLLQNLMQDSSFLMSPTGQNFLAYLQRNDQELDSLSTDGGTTRTRLLDTNETPFTDPMVVEWKKSSSVSLGVTQLAQASLWLPSYQEDLKEIHPYSLESLSTWCYLCSGCHLSNAPCKALNSVILDFAGGTRTILSKWQLKRLKIARQIQEGDYMQSRELNKMVGSSLARWSRISVHSNVTTAVPSYSVKFSEIGWPSYRTLIRDLDLSMKLSLPTPYSRTGPLSNDCFTKPRALELRAIDVAYERENRRVMIDSSKERKGVILNGMTGLRRKTNLRTRKAMSLSPK